MAFVLLRPCGVEITHARCLVPRSYEQQDASRALIKPGTCFSPRAVTSGILRARYRSIRVLSQRCDVRGRHLLSALSSRSAPINIARAAADDAAADDAVDADANNIPAILDSDDEWRVNGDHDFGKPMCIQQGATTWHARKCNRCGVEQRCTHEAGKARVSTIMKPLNPMKLSCPPAEPVRQNDLHIWSQFLTRGHVAPNVRICIRCGHEQEYRRHTEPRGLVLLSENELPCPVETGPLGDKNAAAM